MPGQMIDRTVPPSTRNALPFVAEATGLYRHTQTGSRLLRFFGRCESLEQIDRMHFLEEKLLAFSFDCFLPLHLGNRLLGHIEEPS